MKGKVYSPSDFMGAFVDEIPERSNARKIVETAGTDTPAGKKIRAGATLYGAAATGHPKAKKAVAKIQAKAKAGDPQAKADYNAVKAGKIAIHTAHKAKKKHALKTKYVALNKKGVKTRSKLENKLGDRLARMTRKRQLTKIAHVERRAAHGDRKAKALIAHTVAKAQKGDKQAQTHVAALKLVKNVRLSAKTPAEAHNLKVAHRVVAKAHRGHRGSIKQVRIAQAAAKQGQPNAKRAVARMQIAAAVEKTISTGKVHSVKPTHGASKAVASKKYVAGIKRLKAKKASGGVVTREEVVALAKDAKAAGRPQEAAQLAGAANGYPSSTERLKKTATVAAAAEGGNKEATVAIQKTLEKAENGDPTAIDHAGHLVAVKTIADMQKGLPMDPHVAEATGLVQRANAGDPEAKRIIDRAATAAESGDKKGVTATVAVVAAGAILASTAAKPTAQQQFTDKAAEARGQKLEGPEVQAASTEFAGLYAKVQAGTATESEARRARELAMALKKPQLAAEISALMPPPDLSTVLSSLPSVPLPRIENTGGLIRESLKALLMATADPLQNYREGIRSRSLETMPTGEPEKKV